MKEHLALLPSEKKSVEQDRTIVPETCWAAFWQVLKANHIEEVSREQAELLLDLKESIAAETVPGDDVKAGFYALKREIKRVPLDCAISFTALCRWIG